MSAKRWAAAAYARQAAVDEEQRRKNLLYVPRQSLLDMSSGEAPRTTDDKGPKVRRKGGAANRRMYRGKKK